MVWRREDPQGNESGKIKWEIVRFTRGKGLDIGCGPWKAFPHFIGVDSGKDIQLFGHQFKPDVWIEDATDLKLFATESMDFVFSSHLLEHIEPEHLVKTLKEWLRVIKLGGYLVLYLPDESLYPKVGESGANPDHKWNVSYLRLIELMQKAGSWDLVDWQRRDQGMEYSLYTVFRKAEAGHTFSCTKEKPKKTCGLVRYGAFGDLLQASSVLAGLKEQGYHITLYSSPPGHEVILHDPNVDEFYLQGKDQVPNHCLGEFWAYQAKKYDKWVNLSESVEGTLLAIAGRSVHGMPPAVRHRLMNANYLELQHQIAGVPHNPRVKFFPLEAEAKWARCERRSTGEFTVMYSLSGSSVHKKWPFMDRLFAALMVDFPELHIVTVGDLAGQILEQGWENESRIHRRAGKWSIRESLAFLEQCDLVIGPETGVLNAASGLPLPKIIFLSHSTVENLTRDWVNTHAVISTGTLCPGRGNDEAPACHQLHYNWDHCKNHIAEEDGKPTGVAECQYDLDFESVYRVAWHVITDAMKRAA